MPRIIEYTENEGSAQTSASTLMNLINQSKTATFGIAAFQVKTMVVSSVSAVIFGQAASMLVSPLVGPGLSFLGGAGFGFVGGLVHRWRTDTAEAAEAFAEFPELMEHHLRLSDPSALKSIGYDAWRRSLAGSPVKQGVAIAVLYAAAPAIIRVRELKQEHYQAQEKA